MTDYIADQIKAYKDWISEEQRVDEETLSLSQYSKPGDPSVSKLITEGHSHVFRILESMRIEIARQGIVQHTLDENQNLAFSRIDELSSL